MSLVNVKEALEEAITKSNRLREGLIRGYWKEIVGKLYLKSSPLGIKEEVLFVVVEDSLYLHNMLMKKNIYIEKINEILGKKYIRDIKYRISKVHKLDYSESFTKNTENKEIKNKSKIINLSIDEKIEYLKEKAKEREDSLLKRGFKKCRECGAIFFGESEVCMPCSLKNIPKIVLEEKDDNK